jgi:hypothetical protein
MTATYISGISGEAATGGAAVFVAPDGRLGTSTSSKRFKEDIEPMAKASEALFSLKPVTFHYKKEIDPSRTSQFGLVAEEVEKLNRDLVVRDKDGKPYTVRYDQINAMLLNEFLKEHNKVTAQQRELEKEQVVITELKSTVAELRAIVNEQAAQVQNLSIQVELIKRDWKPLANMP